MQRNVVKELNLGLFLGSVYKQSTNLDKSPLYKGHIKDVVKTLCAKEVLCKKFKVRVKKTGCHN